MCSVHLLLGIVMTNQYPWPADLAVQTSQGRISQEVLHTPLLLVVQHRRIHSGRGDRNIEQQTKQKN